MSIGGAFVFGHGVNTHCIQDLPTPPQGGSYCLAYRVDYYGFIFSAYVRDGGYAIKDKQHNLYEPLDDARIAQYQQQGVLPKQLPPYRIPAATYFWGVALWPMLLMFVVVAQLRRRAALRRHAAEVKPVDAGASGIELVATRWAPVAHSSLVAPSIEIDGGARQVRWWSTWKFPVEPGKHTIKVYYVWFNEKAVAKITVDVMPGEIKRITYKLGPLGIGKARLVLDEAVPSARVEKTG